MNCHRIGAAVVCAGRTVYARCGHRMCKRRHRRQCDFPVLGGTGTCDLKLCELHTHTQDDGRDFCPYHQVNRAGLDGGRVAAGKVKS